MPELDPATIVRALNRHDVRHVVIGGIAAEIHDPPYRPLSAGITVRGHQLGDSAPVGREMVHHLRHDPVRHRTALTRPTAPAAR